MGSNYREWDEISNKYKKVSSEIEDMLSKEEGTNKLGVNLILHCVEELAPEQIDLLDEMLLTFKCELDVGLLSSGLSIIYMNYLSYGLNTYKGIYDAHNRLFSEWKPNKVEKWVIFKLSKINIRRVV